MGSLGKNLASARVRLGMSQEELSRRTGLRMSLISDRERGRYPDIRLSNLLKLAAALQVPVELMISGANADYDAMIASLGPEHAQTAARTQDLRTIRDLEQVRDSLYRLCSKLLSRERDFCADADRVADELQTMSGDAKRVGSTPDRR